MDGLSSVGIESALAAEADRKAAEDELGQNQFLEMLVAQLENQDPLSPQDSADFAAQLAQFSSVEQLVAMRAGIDELVEALSQQNSSTNGASAVDASSLIGREVVVYGSQIEVDAAQSPITMPIRLGSDATSANVRIYDAEGRLRHEASVLPTDSEGRPIALRPGDHDYVFDPAANNLPEGVYAIEFSAQGTNGEDVTVLPMVQGVVTGAILAGGDPAIRIGSRIFSIEDVLEVRLPTNAAGSNSADAATAYQTGGGQTVLSPWSGRTPQ